MSRTLRTVCLSILLLSLVCWPSLLGAQAKDKAAPANEPDQAAVLEKRLELLTKQLDAMQEQIKALRDVMGSEGRKPAGVGEAQQERDQQAERAAKEREARILRDAQVAQIYGSLERMKAQIDAIRQNKELTPQQLRERVKTMLKAEEAALERSPAMGDVPQPAAGRDGRATPKAPRDADSTKRQDIIETAAAVGQFKTFLSLVKAAELTDTLKKEGAFTVFAPTDAAFDKLPADMLASLQSPQGKQRLVALLKNHIVAESKIRGRDVGEKKTVETLGGRELQIVSADGKLTIGRATITRGDIEAGNGVIQGIDEVLVGPGPGMGRPLGRGGARGQ